MSAAIPRTRSRRSRRNWESSSDIVLASERLDALAGARAIALETRVVLRQNQRWALGYNLAAMPLAALGFFPPWLAAIGMSASSLIVVMNALRMGRQRGVRTPAAASAKLPVKVPA